MSKKEYDVCVIGSGPAGYVAAINAAKNGLKVVCIEKNSTLGGTCLNVGCIPSKTLLNASEEYVYFKKTAPDIGINASDVKFDLKQMMDNKLKVVKSLVDGIKGLFKTNKVIHIEGIARFIDANKVEVKTADEKKVEVEADYFILATGSEPVELPFMKFDGKKILSSTEVLSLKQVPKNMVVVGAGVIGVELASVYNRLGAKVSVIEMLPDICMAMDDTIRKNLLRSLKQQGIEFYLSSKLKSAKVNDTSVTVEYEEAGVNKEIEADVVLVAVGRKPYTSDLNLESIGIKKTDKGFVVVDADFKTTLSHVFAVGDVIEGPMLAHKASDEAAAVINYIANKESKVNYLAIPNVIYTHPEAAAVGLTEEEAKKMEIKVATGTAYFKANARARCISDTDGIVKVVADADTKKILGIHILGSLASEMIGIGVVAIENKMTVNELLQCSFAHPTLAESIKEALENI